MDTSIIIRIMIGILTLLNDSSEHLNANKSYLGSFVSKSKLGVYKRAAVSTDSAPCAAIGRKILQQDGTAADSIIAVLLCMGVTIPESMGLGGGSMLLFYNRTERQAYVIDARETAAAAASKDMFHGNEKLASDGPLSIAVPGELSGYWVLHKRFGKLPWNKLFNGTMELAQNGFHVGKYLAKALKQNEKIIKQHQTLRNVYLNPKNNETWKQGEVMKQPQLAQTLKNLSQSDDPHKLFYEQIAKVILQDIKNQANEWDGKQPVLTEQDFNEYKADVTKMVVTASLTRGNLHHYTVPIPGSGIVLSFILRVMEKYNDYNETSKSLNGSINFFHRLTETFKYAYAKRMMLGDDHFEDVQDTIKNLTSQDFINFVHSRIDDTKTYPAFDKKTNSSHYNVSYYMKDDHGTAHVSVVDKWGNAAAVTTTVNLYFGSKVYSPSTGILLNDEMNDFSAPDITNAFGLPPTSHNLIEPKKKPLSSMAPSVFTDQNTGQVKLVIGGAGGTKITTAIALVAIRHLWFGEDIKKAIDAPRIHHQLFPDEINYESNFPRDILNGLAQRGHKLVKHKDDEMSSYIMAISSDENHLYANSDYRKGGGVDGI